MRLLIVEDEAGLVSALQVALRREGYAVDQARTVAEAREKLGLNPYDVVLLDITLPDGTGFDLPAPSAPGRCRSPRPTRRGSSCSPPADASPTG